MVYRLPFRDWLELDKARAPTEPLIPEPPQNEGGN